MFVTHDVLFTGWLARASRKQHGVFAQHLGRHHAVAGWITGERRYGLATLELAPVHRHQAPVGHRIDALQRAEVIGKMRVALNPAAEAPGIDT